MDAWYVTLALALLVNMGVGLMRILRGPTAADRMLATMLFSTTGTATLLVLAHAVDQPALRDVGLVLALLAAIATIVFVTRAGGARGGVSSTDQAVES